MKTFICALIFTFATSLTGFAQTDKCFYVDSVYSTAKFKNIGKRNILFGVKQLTEELVSEKYCIKPGSTKITVEVFYFGMPRKEVRMLGVGKEEAITQVGIKLYVDQAQYEGYGESETEIRTVMLEVVEEEVPFSKMTLSNAIKKALEKCVSQL